MAPEFFGFFLAAGLIAACGLLFILAVLPLRFRTWLFPKRPDLIRKVALLTLVPIAAVLLLLVWFLRQQFFLNEPMAEAARQGEIEKVRTLLQEGASPNSWGIDGIDTALTGATEYGHTEVVKLLLTNGANPNLTDNRGRTPLKLARGKKDIEEALIKVGAKE